MALRPAGVSPLRKTGWPMMGWEIPLILVGVKGMTGMAGGCGSVVFVDRVAIQAGGLTIPVHPNSMGGRGDPIIGMWKNGRGSDRLAGGDAGSPVGTRALFLLGAS